MNKQDIIDRLSRLKGITKYLNDELSYFERCLLTEMSIETGDIFKKTIENCGLNLSMRTYNVLNIHNIKTIGQLVQHKESDILKMENMGRKSFNELKEKLSEIGLGFNMYVDFAKEHVGG